jgi:hypothetical protein
MSSATVQKELASLEKMTTGGLRAKYRELFGDEARSWNRQWLFRRCAWRVQAVAEGGLPERARQRAMEIADDADIRFIPPRPVVPDESKPRQAVHSDLKPDDRLPMGSAVLTRPFKGRLHMVTVLPNGFEYDGEVYRSLSAVAHAITGSHWNGYHFFRTALLHAKQAEESR